MRPLRALALLLAAAAMGLLVWVLARRFAYPYDLEWMEGGMLCHALRLGAGAPIYAAPSVDFVPFLYTPLYPAIVALLGSLAGIGYALGRAVSLLGFGAALVLGYVFVRREGGSRAAAACALALPAAAFVPTGAWYDLARPDSLFLGLVSAGLLLGWWRRRSHAGVAMAALLLVAAFFTKQTASPFMVALGIALLFANWRVLPTYVATLAIVGLPLLWWLDRGSDGWFWTYVFRLHQQHDFYPVRAFVGTPIRLLLLFGPAVLLVPWALYRRGSPGLVYATFLAGAGTIAACVGFGTQWAFWNAFIPGVYFPSLAIGVAAGRLITGAREEAPPRLRPAAVYLLLSIALLAAPGGPLARFGRIAPFAWGIDRDLPTGYDPRRYVPSAADRHAGDRLLAILRTTPGEVLIPFHPFYPHLVGKRTFLHRMGVLDVGRSSLGAPRGLAQAIAEERFQLVVMDDKIAGTWQMWPGLRQRYRITDQIAGPRVVSGAPTEPRFVMAPPPPPPPAESVIDPGQPIDRELQ